MKVKATEGKGYLTIKSRRPPKANIGTPEKCRKEYGGSGLIHPKKELLPIIYNTLLIS